MSDNNALPQAEIDTLIKQANGKTAEPVPEVKAEAVEKVGNLTGTPVVKNTGPPQEPEPVSQSVVQMDTEPDDYILETIQSALDSLTRRIEKVEESIGKIVEAEGNTSGSDDHIQILSEKLSSGTEDLKRASRRIEEVVAGLKETPGYGIRSFFTCESCGSSSFIAIPVRCTECGNEGWWGWWPPEK
jgi:seryl-tRNA synthetase